MGKCDKRERIIHMDCEYRDGKFYMQYLPGCLPTVFTARFKAPADFTQGDTIVVKDAEMPVMTSQMEAASTGIFKTGVIMMCEIDLDRNLAFIRTGGGFGSGEDVEFQTSDIVYYIDPNGDDSPYNSGGVDSPFKTLAGAGRAAWHNIVMNPLGQLTFSFNPGNYDLNSADLLLMTEANHPLGLVFRGSNQQDKPVLNADHFICKAGLRKFENLRLRGTAQYTVHTVLAESSAVVNLQDVEIIAGKPNCYLVFSFAQSVIQILGSLRLNGNGHNISIALGVHESFFRTFNTSIIALENLPQVTNAFARSTGGQIWLPGTSFTGSTSGKRYDIIANGVINTESGRPDYLPGTINGTTATGGQYL